MPPALYRAVNRADREADALHMVGWCAARLGSYDTARAYCQTALALQRQHRYATGEAATLHTLGYVEHHTGHHQQAIGNTSQSAQTLDSSAPRAALAANSGGEETPPFGMNRSF